MNTIIISRAWLEGLVYKAKQVRQSQEPYREQWSANLLGYIESAESFLKEKQ